MTTEQWTITNPVQDKKASYDEAYHSVSANPLTTPVELADRYCFEEELGHGAQGQVFLARRLSDNVRVAIKRLRIDSVSTWKEYTLFRREADVLASLNIPGVVRLYEACEYINAVPPCSYIVQEYLDGMTMQKFVESGMRMTIAQVCDVVCQLLTILYQFHHHDPVVIHRDIKPSNIMLIRENANYRVYLLDFGAVSNPQLQGGGSTVAGTFGYMPPEQYTGSISPQSDFYSLGVTAIHMLTGLEPFEMTANVYELQYRDKLLEIVPDARPELFELLDCMIAPDPKKRPDTAEQLFLAIQRVTKGLSPFPKDEDVGLDANALKKVHGQNDHSAKRLLKRQTERTTGRVRTTRQFKESYVEYTFEANGRTWCGLDKRIRLKLDEAMQMPREMVVRYDKEDPTNNSIVFYW